MYPRYYLLLCYYYYYFGFCCCGTDAHLFCSNESNNKNSYNKYCLNGGICVEGLSKKTGKLIQVCDCQNAIDEEGNRYVGLYCEIKAPKKDQFCVNGGVPRTISSGVIVCSCSLEYTGAYCELSKNSTQVQAYTMHIAPDTTTRDDAKDVEECSMECWNGGRCALGAHRPTEAELALYPNYNPHNITDTDDSSFLYEHCQCPNGFYGIKCETTYDICTVDNNDNNEQNTATTNEQQQHFYCHNNATCVYTTTTNNNYNIDQTRTETTTTNPLLSSRKESRGAAMCNCTAAHRPGKHYTGRNCEYLNLITCNIYGLKISERTFCANGGTCTKNVITGHWSCSCPEGYNGKHCENFGSNVNRNNLPLLTLDNRNNNNDNDTTRITIPTTTSGTEQQEETYFSIDQKDYVDESRSSSSLLPESSIFYNNTNHTIDTVFFAVSIAILVIVLFVAFVVFRVNNDSNTYNDGSSGGVSRRFSSSQFPSSIEFGSSSSKLRSILSFRNNSTLSMPDYFSTSHPDLGAPTSRRSSMDSSSGARRSSMDSGSGALMVGSMECSSSPSNNKVLSSALHKHPSFRATMSALPMSVTRVAREDDNDNNNNGTTKTRRPLSSRMLGMTSEEQKELNDLM